jgi:flagellar FliL protein
MAKKPNAKPEENNKEQSATAAADGDKKKKLILLGGIAAVLLVVAAGGTFLALGMMGGDEEKVAVEGDDKPAAEAPAKPAKAPAIYETLEPPFLTNYTVQGRPRYLQLSIALMAREQSGIDAAKKHMPVIRNRIVLLLSGEDFATLQTDAGRSQLQQKILAAVQEILQRESGSPGIEQVFFTAMVMQ